MEELRHNPETIVSSSVWQEAESCMWCYLCMCGGSVLDSQLGRQTPSPVWHLNIVSSLRGWKLTSDQHINTCIFIRGGTRGVSYILSVIYTKYCRSPITTEMAASTPLLWYCVKFLQRFNRNTKGFPNLTCYFKPAVFRAQTPTCFFFISFFFFFHLMFHLCLDWVRFSTGGFEWLRVRWRAASVSRWGKSLVSLADLHSQPHRPEPSQLIDLSLNPQTA